MHLDSTFRPAWWLPGPHLQTLWPAVARRRPRCPFRRERLELPDGDFLDLDWHDDAGAGPLALLLHGLEGSSASHYMRGLCKALSARGIGTVAMHFRGCSGTPNRLARSYHSGETGDLDHVVALLRRRFPGRPLFAVGYSLGGNVLLKWLGEQGERAGVAAAVAVSVPLVLATAAARMAGGFSRFYQWVLVRQLRRSMRRKAVAVDLPVDLALLPTLNDFRRFDEHITGPLHGFAGADDYYARSSSRPFLRAIRVPTLIVHAVDDPFMDPSVIPSPDELSDAVTLELSRHGGHVGFVAGAVPLRPVYWLEGRIAGFLEGAAGTNARTPNRQA